MLRSLFNIIPFSKLAHHCCPGKINTTTKKFDNQNCTEAFAGAGKYCRPAMLRGPTCSIVGASVQCANHIGLPAVEAKRSGNQYLQTFIQVQIKAAVFLLFPRTLVISTSANQHISLSFSGWD